jgi:complex iron-sulfur molybdoenzyme family reductase subunit gamma
MEITTLDATAEQLSDPSNEVWQNAAESMVDLDAAPVASQPSAYIRTVYTTPRNSKAQLAVRAARAGEELFIRLAWKNAQPSTHYGEQSFPDGAAILFPLKGSAPLEQMGSADQPVSIWHWRPDLDYQVEQLTATGLGTVTRTDPLTVRAASTQDEDGWQVVLWGRTGGATKGTLQVAFALWNGNAGERAGIKSYSRAWQELNW